MFNDLIGKNKELGRFLFCERYTLPPVKNAMYIAEGQELKRGAVVDVNGVLVGTNSLMPYAVLEFDCDTRSGGKEASVFIKGEFNFDKLSFASGLSKSDLDNIVYNGSGIGIVIKPYEYAEGFSPLMVPAGTSQSNPLMNAEETERMIDEMKSIEAMTLRFEFSKKDYNPETAGVGSAGTWTKVDSPTLNVWDWTTDATDWTSAFQGAFPDADNEVRVIAAGDTSDVVNISYLFAGELTDFAYKSNYSLAHRNNVVSCVPFDVSSCVNFEGVFEGSTLRNVVPFKYNPSLTYPSGETHSVIFADTYIENVSDLDFYGITSVSSGLFARCSKLKKVSLKGLYNFTYFDNTFWSLNTNCCTIEEFELIGGLNSSSLTLFFQNCRNLKKVSGLINNNNIDRVGCQGVFLQCFALEDVEFSVGKADRVDYLFGRCNVLKKLPYVDTSLCKDFTRFARNTQIETIPDIDVSSATNVSYMFTSCQKVKHGILEMYNKLLARGSAITSHTDCFKNCGINTPEGRAALAQIPQSWGGLAEG